MIGGLKNEPRDPRNFKLGSVVSLPKLSELPEEFELTPLTIKDQGDSDKCSAYATDTISELQEGVELNPEWGFAASKKISGDPDEWGQAIIPALKRHKEYGALEKSISPNLTFRNIKDWPDLFYSAIKHKKKSFVEITGQYDHFFNVQTSIWKYRHEKRGAVMGLDWSWSLSDYILKGTKSGFGHLIAITGWNKDGLILLNSAGTKAGQNGRHILPREEANHFIEKYGGAYMFVDLSPEEVKYALEKGIKIEQLNILNKMVVLLRTFIKYLDVKKIAGFFGEIIGAVLSKRN